jgi:hypothetical protein
MNETFQKATAPIEKSEEVIAASISHRAHFLSTAPICVKRKITHVPFVRRHNTIENREGLQQRFE